MYITIINFLIFPKEEHYEKYNNQKGQDLIEYALLLAIVVGIGSFIYSGSGMKDSISSIFGNTSNILGIAASDSANPSKDTVDDRNMKWLLEKFLGYTTSKDNDFAGYLGNTPQNRHGPDFSADKPNGLIDSASDSKFVNKIDSSILGENSSWVFTGYTDNGKTYYGVSIYDPSKNDGKKLSDLDYGTTITTDIYRVDPNTNTVEKLTSNASQTATKRTDPATNKTYTVIRDTPTT